MIQRYLLIHDKTLSSSVRMHIDDGLEFEPKTIDRSISRSFLLFFTLLLLSTVTACTKQRMEETTRPFSTLYWSQQDTGTDERFQAISAVDELIVWVSGTGGTYARTTNGGTSWSVGIVQGADSLEFRDVHAVDAEVAYLLSAGPGETSRIYKTTDAGRHWTRQFTNMDPNGFFDCLDFWNPLRGLAYSDTIDGSFYIITTEDGGDTWTRVPSADLPAALPGEGGFAASGTCVITQGDGNAWIGTGASGIEARVLRTTDYGRTWDVSTTPLPSNSPTSGIFSLAFRSALNGAALGGDYARPDSTFSNVAVTVDGGATWTLAGQTRMSGAVFGATYIPGAPIPTLVAVSPVGSDYSTDNGETWAGIDSVNYWSVTFAGPEAGWAVGPEGRIVKAIYK